MPDPRADAGGDLVGAGGDLAGAPLRMASHITSAEAAAVFRRKLPGARTEVRETVHPFWWVELTVTARGLLARRTGGTRTGGPAGRRMNVLVNASTGRGFLADFDLRGESIGAAEWDGALASAGPGVGPEDAARTARTLVRTKVIRTVKLGMRISIAEAGPPRAVLKPNWLVTGANEKHSATILVDGLDSSHYIVRVEKLPAGESIRDDTADTEDTDDTVGYGPKAVLRRSPPRSVEQR